MSDEKKNTVEQLKSDSEQAKTSADNEKLSQDELEAVAGGIFTKPNQARVNPCNHLELDDP